MKIVYVMFNVSFDFFNMLNFFFGYFKIVVNWSYKYWNVYKFRIVVELNVCVYMICKVLNRII